MKLNVKLPLKYKTETGKKPIKVQEIFLNYLIISINSKYPQGLDGTYRRTFARLQNKFDEAIDKNLKTIDIESSELDLMKNAFQDGKLPISFSSNALLMEESIEKAEKEKK
jgi:hypothetical protein